MGKVINIIRVDNNPIQYIGQVAGACWGADVTDTTKNYKRGLECLENDHGRTFEYPSVTIEISGYSARAMRELYTHIIGTSRLQESTRYVNCEDFCYFVPHKVEVNDAANNIYKEQMESVKKSYVALLEAGIPKEDAANILPLGMFSKMVLKINLRALLHLFELRLCTRAYHEIRMLMLDLKSVLSLIDNEWYETMEKFAVIKCMKVGFCTEKYCCGLRPKKEFLKPEYIMCRIDDALREKYEFDTYASEDNILDTVREVLEKYLKL